MPALIKVGVIKQVSDNVLCKFAMLLQICIRLNITYAENGISGYVDLKATEKGNIVTYSDTTTSEGIFYQPDDFIGYSHVQGLYPFAVNKWNEKSLLYFVSLFKKGAGGRFDYANKFNRKIAKTIIVYLPTKNNQPDFDFMETYIHAVEKVVIKNVVTWKDKEIEKTKEVVA